MLSNHYMREVYVNELYPNRDQSSYSGVTSTLPILNLAFYPQGAVRTTSLPTSTPTDISTIRRSRGEE